MDTFIQLTDTSDTTHRVRIGALSKYTDAGGAGAHAAILMDNGQALTVKETPTTIDGLIATALA